MPRQTLRTNEGNLENVQNPSNNVPQQNDQQPQQGQVKAPQPKQAPSLLDSEENRSILQTIKEEIKFELKQEIVDALNSEHMSLIEIDPQTSYCLKACASAINKSVSNIFPIGGNELFNQQQQAQQNGQQMVGQQQQQQPQQQQQKQAAAEELSDFLVHSTITKLASTEYFNQQATEQEFMQDIYNTVEIITNGMNKFAEDNYIDFYDPNNQDLLIELINDGTLYDLGSDAE